MICRGSPRTLLSCALALAAATGCASRQTVVVHSEPRVVAEGEERLAAEIQDLEDGGVSLRVFRERDRVLEQEFWKMQGEGRSASRATASVGMDPLPSSGTGDPFGQLALAGLITVGAIVVGIGYGVYLAFEAMVTGLASLVSHAPTVDIQPAEDRVVVRRTEQSRALSSSVILVRADTGQFLNLGPQPTEGYRIDAAHLAHLGGRGVIVVVRDGSLSIEVSLGSPR